MKLYRIKHSDRISYLTTSMKYKIEKLFNEKYWELKEFRNNRYITVRYFLFFRNAKQYLTDNI